MISRRLLLKILAAAGIAPADLMSNIALARHGRGAAAASTATNEFALRTSAPMTVWAHPIAVASEVNQFRETLNYGMDPTGTGSGSTSTVQFDSDGTGTFMRITIPTGGTSNGQWSRPMGAFNAGQPGSSGGNGNGLTTADPAANGTVRLNTWDSADTAMAYNWQQSYYANPAVISHFTGWPLSSDTGAWDGTEFWLRFDVRISSSRWSSGNPGGKLIFIDVTDEYSDLQELVIRSANNTGDLTGYSYYQTNPYLMYTSRGNYNNSVIDATQGGGDETYTGTTSIEPGPLSPYAASCTYSGANTSGNCAEYPSGGWVTVLLHVIPGQDNGDYTLSPPSGNTSGWPYHDTTIELFVWQTGGNGYTQVFSMNDLAWLYYSTGQSGGTNGPNGWWHAPAFNEVGPTGYMNDVDAVTGWTQDFRNLLFSRDYILSPGTNDLAPSWYTSLPTSQWSEIPGTGTATIIAAAPSPEPGVGDGRSDTGTSAVVGTWTGATVDQHNGLFLALANGGHGDYCGNEGYVLRLRSSSPGWARFIDPTPNTSIVYSASGPQYWQASAANGYSGASTVPFDSGAYSGYLGVVQNGGNIYYLTQAGTSAASGGPTGTGTGIVDGTCIWNYLGPVSNGMVNTDGRPLSMHTSSFQCWGDGQIWYPYENSYSSGDGASIQAMFGFSLADVMADIEAGTSLAWDGTIGPWTAYGTNSSLVANDGDGQTQFGCSCFDRWGHMVWGFGGSGADKAFGYGMNVWNISTLGPTQGQSAYYNVAINADAVWAVCCFDLRIIVVCNASTQTGGQNIIVLNLDNIGGSGWATAITPTGTGYYGNGIASNFAGAAYIPRSRQIAVMDPPNNGATIYYLTVPTTTDSFGRTIYNPSGIWAWNNITPSGSAPVVQSGINKTYSWANIIEDMGDGSSALIYCGGTGVGTYIFKIPNGGL